LLLISFTNTNLKSLYNNKLNRDDDNAISIILYILLLQLSPPPGNLGYTAADSGDVHLAVPSKRSVVFHRVWAPAYAVVYRDGMAGTSAEYNPQPRASRSLTVYVTHKIHVRVGTYAENEKHAIDDR